eukprot:467108-Pelagomonas_calceolata.AAC.7
MRQGQPHTWNTVSCTRHPVNYQQGVLDQRPGTDFTGAHLSFAYQAITAGPLLDRLFEDAVITEHHNLELIERSDS